MRPLIIAWITLLMLAAPVAASDLEKEQRWREQVEDSIMDGEAVDLVVEGRKIFAIYMEAGCRLTLMKMFWRRLARWVAASDIENFEPG